MEPARITITFKGGEEYKEGVTPIVERPYKRYVREGKTEVIQTFGRNNPTITSSNANEHTPGMASDGNIRTYWKASAEDKSPFWTVNTEKGLQLKEIQLHFPDEAARRYIVEASHITTHGKYSVTRVRIRKQNRNLLLSFSEEVPTGRFVRIRFLEKRQGCIDGSDCERDCFGIREIQVN